MALKAAVELAAIFTRDQTDVKDKKTPKVEITSGNSFNCYRFVPVSDITTDLPKWFSLKALRKITPQTRIKNEL